MVIRITCRTAHKCDECHEAIQPGDTMVVYDDIAVDSLASFATGIQHTHARRRYCKSCGELLEDSLTTTGAWAATSGPSSRKDL
jgi:RNase P subunit RPR2